MPQQAVAVITCDNSYTLYVNGQQVQAGDNWQAPDVVALDRPLSKPARTSC